MQDGCNYLLDQERHLKFHELYFDHLIVWDKVQCQVGLKDPIQFLCYNE